MPGDGSHVENVERTEAFAKFILSARHEYDVLCESIAGGGVPAGHGVIVRIEVPADWVDRIRFDLIASLNGGLDGGIRSS